MTQARRAVEIANVKGLHMRASRLFVEMASQFAAKVVVRADGRDAEANSVLNLLELLASKGMTIEISATGDEAEDAVTALVQLVEAKFNEEA